MGITCGDFCLLLLGIFLPPVAALIKCGCSADFLINIGLTLLGFIPGTIHAWYLIFKYQDYYVVEGPTVYVRYEAVDQPNEQPQAPPSYGSVS